MTGGAENKGDQGAGRGGGMVGEGRRGERCTEYYSESTEVHSHEEESKAKKQRTREY